MEESGKRRNKENNKKENNKKKNNNNDTWYPVMTVLLIFVTAVTSILTVHFYMRRLTVEQDTQKYDKYYVMIAENTNASLWQSIYEGACEAGQEENSYVDLLDGIMDNDYSKEDLMRIAISSEVDGIIVAADESDEMTGLIDEAAARGIPVVTLYGDNTKSARCSFVGIGSYDLGREYGRQVLKVANERETTDTAARKRPVRVMVLVSSYTQDYGQNILCSGIQETIEKEKQAGMEIELSLFSTDDVSMFSAEESIRDIFMEEELPDIIVCLNELSTTCVYQAVVDYNKVGQVSILGYYDSDTIIKAIDRNVIYATISIDTRQMGKYCVEALTEYNTTGNTSQYFIADIALINKENVHLFTGGDNEKDVP